MLGVQNLAHCGASLHHGIFHAPRNVLFASTLHSGSPNDNAQIELPQALSFLQLYFSLAEKNAALFLPPIESFSFCFCLLRDVGLFRLRTHFRDSDRHEAGVYFCDLRTLFKTFLGGLAGVAF